MVVALCRSSVRGPEGGDGGDKGGDDVAVLGVSSKVKNIGSPRPQTLVIFSYLFTNRISDIYEFLFRIAQGPPSWT